MDMIFFIKFILSFHIPDWAADGTASFSGNRRSNYFPEIKLKQFGGIIITEIPDIEMGKAYKKKIEILT